MFREQVSTISTWFDRWTPCEQTVAMAALLRRLHPIQARFLTTLLHKQLAECNDLRRAEILANDTSFVTSLIETESPSVRELLLYLPLLNPKNQDVKNLYLSVIPKVLMYTLNNCAQMEETRQLLSYSLIHPAFSFDEIRNFATMLHQFEEKLKTVPANGDNLGCQYPNLSESPPNFDFGGSWQQPANTNTTGSNQNTSTAPSVSQSGLSIGNFNGFHKIRRSNSLTPPVLRSDAWNSQDELCSSKPRSLSLSSEISPQSSLGSSGSGSESRLDDPRPTFINPGMKDVPNWLKSLRLHKYAFLFAHLTYEEMMNLTEIKLEAQGVTKGARHKIVLSIAKLKERAQHLKKVYEELVSDKESIRNALNEIKWALSAPVKPAPVNEANTVDADAGNNKEVTSASTGSTTTTTPVSVSTVMAPIGFNRYQDESSKGQTGEQLFRNELNFINTNPSEVDGGDFTVWVVRILGKACELNPDMECEGLLVSVLERCMAHDVFTPKQKRLLTLWRQQQAPAVRRNSSGGHSQFPHRYWSGGSPSSTSSGSQRGGGRHFSPRVLNVGNQGGSTLNQGQPSSSWSPSSTYALFMAKRPSLQDSVLEAARSQSQFHLSVQRTKSAPLPNPNFFAPLSSSPPSFTTRFDQFTSQQIPTTGFTGIGSGSGLPTLSLSNSPPPPIGSSLISGMQTNTSYSSASTTSTMDITSRLESLCLSMTEAALGSAFSN